MIAHAGAKNFIELSSSGENFKSTNIFRELYGQNESIK
jgi:hypothetical protein